MDPDGRTIQPFAVFRAQALSLEAALACVSARPSSTEVHTVRTAIRKVEGQCLLLSLMPSAKESGCPAKLRRRLKQVRRAAGAVRDLDVQRKTLKALSKQEELPARTRAEAHWLRRKLKAMRNQEATALLQTLRKRQNSLVRQVEKYLRELRAADPWQVTPEEIVAMMRQWFLAGASGTAGSVEELHDRRKAAKLVRYVLAANQPAVPGAQRSATAAAADAFHAVQQSGGDWHDALLLQQLATARAGKHSTVATQQRQQSDEALERYRNGLGQLTALGEEGAE